LASFDGAVLQAVRETESALNNYAHDLRKERSSVAARDAAKRAVDEVLRLQRDGRADQLAVLDAERTLASAELSLAQLRTGISTDQIAIFLALGGGWQEPATEDASSGR
jgi:outer membrane protein TolC